MQRPNLGAGILLCLSSGEGESGGKKQPHKNAPYLCWFNCCVVDACEVKSRKELQVFVQKIFQNPAGNLCQHWRPEAFQS